MEENFYIAAFRSRQQVMAYEKALRMHGVEPTIITTPRAVAMGCGLSVRFGLGDLDRARQAYRQMPPGNLVGFYNVNRDASGRTVIHPVNSRAY